MPDPDIFTTKFDRFVCDGESIRAESEGFTLVATVYHDDHNEAPWDNEDGHGPVSEWTNRAKHPGELILTSERGGCHRYYDMQEAVRIARKDGWGYKGMPEGEAPGARAAIAARKDFEALKAWCDDEWHYVGVAVVVSKNGVELTGQCMTTRSGASKLTIPTATMRISLRWRTNSHPKRWSRRASRWPHCAPVRACHPQRWRAEP